MKQDPQLLLHKLFHLINVSCSILNTSLMHFYLNLKIHPLDACHHASPRDTHHTALTRTPSPTVNPRVVPGRALQTLAPPL